MLKEIEMIDSFDTFREATAEDLKTMRTIGTRWVITSKPLPDNLSNVKARLVVQDVNYGLPMDTFAATPTGLSVRLVLLRAMERTWKVGITDLSSAFLHAKLEPSEQVIITAPKAGWSLPLAWYVCMRALYGLRTSPRIYQEDFATRLQKHGVQRAKADPQVFFESDGSLYDVHVDDMIYTGPDLDAKRNTFIKH